MKTLSAIRQQIANFDRDERGMETLQVVLIIAIAAIILALIVKQWEGIRTWVLSMIGEVTDMKKPEKGTLKGIQ